MPLKASQRSPLRYPGSKTYLVPHIVPRIPPHEVYVEPFCGSAVVLLNKPRSPVEIINDLSSRITNFWEVLRDDPDEFRKLLQLTPYSAIEFDNAALDFRTNRVERARRDYVMWRQSFGGAGKSFSETIHRVRGKSNDREHIGFADVVSSWLSSIDIELPKIAERIRGVQIVNRDALQVIQKWDGENVFQYLDPPYAHESRVSTDVYEHEFSSTQHIELSRVLHACKGKVILSGYDSDLYSKLYADWNKTEIEIAMHAAGGKEKSRATEVLWQNF